MEFSRSSKQPIIIVIIPWPSQLKSLKAMGAKIAESWTIKKQTQPTISQSLFRTQVLATQATKQKPAGVC